MTHLPKTISVNGLVKDPHTARIQVSGHVLQSGGFDYVGEQLLEVLLEGPSKASVSAAPKKTAAVFCCKVPLLEVIQSPNG